MNSKVKVKEPVRALSEKVSFTDDMCVQIFESLATRSMHETGLYLGLGPKYKNSSSMIAGISRAFGRVMANPEHFGIPVEVAHQTDKIIKSRNSIASKSLNTLKLESNLKELDGKSFEELVMNNRVKAWTLLQLKMNDILSSKQKREKVSVGELAKVAGITFDKGQLVEGKATDHVALMAKVDTETTPEAAMQQILKMREYNIAMQQDKK